MAAGGEFLEQTRHHAAHDLVGSIAVEGLEPIVVNELFDPGVIELDDVVGTAARSQICGQTVGDLIPAHVDELDLDAGLRFKLTGLFLVEADGVHLVPRENDRDLFTGLGDFGRRIVRACGRGSVRLRAACGSEGCKQHQSGQNETQSTFFHIESSVFCFFSGDGPGKFCFAAIVLLTVRLEAMRFFLS